MKKQRLKKWADDRSVCSSVFLQSWLAGWFAEVLRRCFVVFWHFVLFKKGTEFLLLHCTFENKLILLCQPTPCSLSPVSPTGRQARRQVVRLPSDSLTGFKLRLSTVGVLLRETEERQQKRKTKEWAGRGRDSVVRCTGGRVYSTRLLADPLLVWFPRRC